jgi:L,D-transpeptidase ErfK/SrfK
MKCLSWLSLLLAGLLGTAQATVYELPADGSSVVGTDTHIKTVFKDTLLDIARRNSLGYYEIIRANPGVDMWLPGEGTDVMLPGRRILPPGPREGIVVNLPEHRLYYYPKPKKGEKPVVITYPVSIGKMDWKTPIGETRVIQKEKHPTWYPPESVRKEHIANGDPIPAVVKAGPDNPLGDYAMRLAAGNGTYLIHGTNNPMAVGMAITHGCVRMYPEDVAALFPLIPVGTKVWLINEPVKVAFVDGELFLEAHPQVDEEGQNTSTEPDLNLLSEKLDQALGTSTAAIHWDFAKEALQAANGIPTVVGLEADPDTGPPATDPTATAPAQPAHPAASTPSPAAPSSAGTAERTSPTGAASSTSSATHISADVTTSDASPANSAEATKPSSSPGTPDATQSSPPPAAGTAAKDAAPQPSLADATKAPSTGSTPTTASDTSATNDPPTTILRPVLHALPPSGAAANPQPDSTASAAPPEH